MERTSGSDDASKSEKKMKRVSPCSTPFASVSLSQPPKERKKEKKLTGLEDLLLFNGTRHTSDASRPEKLNDPGNDEDLCKTEFLLGELIDVVEEIHAKVPSARLRIVDLLGEVLEIGEVGKGVERELLNVLEGEGRGEAREVVEEEVSFVSFRFCESL